jgi:hypothetical protein
MRTALLLTTMLSLSAGASNRMLTREFKLMLKASSSPSLSMGCDFGHSLGTVSWDHRDV